MLLRRVTENVKAQNWTAVALDFVIVVVGVFIGIQVANWNAAIASLRNYSYDNIAGNQSVIARLDRTLAELEMELAEKSPDWRSSQ